MNALAYENGVSLKTIDGKEVDFSNKSVSRSAVIGTPDSLQELADKMELSENRKNSTVGRRMTIALPHEISVKDRWSCAEKFGEFMHQEYGLAVVVAMHAPDKGGSQKNWHAHLTMSDRKVDQEGNFGAKARELSSRKDGEAKKNLEKIREKWADICNEALEKNQNDERIDHRSYKDQGLKGAEPSTHLGRSKTEIARKKDEKGAPKYNVPEVAINKERVKNNRKKLEQARHWAISDAYEEAKKSNTALSFTKFLDQFDFNTLVKPQPKKETAKDRFRSKLQAIREKKEKENNVQPEGKEGDRTPIERKPKAERRGPIFGSREWIAQDRARRNKVVSEGASKALDGIRSTLGRVREAIGKIRGGFPEATRRDSSLEGFKEQNTPRFHLNEKGGFRDGEYGLPEWRAKKLFHEAEKDPQKRKLWSKEAFDKASKIKDEQGIER